MDTLDGAELTKMLRRHYVLILAVALAAFAVGMGWTLASPPRFTSSARLYLGELEDKGQGSVSGNHDIDLSPGGRGDIGSEIEILKSRSLVTRAVLASGLNTTVTRPGLRAPRYWKWLLSHRSVELVDGAADELAAIDTFPTTRTGSPGIFQIRFVNATEYELHRDSRLIGRGRLGDVVEGEGLTVRLVAGHSRRPPPGASYEVEVEPLDDVVAWASKTLEVSTPTSKAPTGGDMVKITNLSFSARSPRKAASFIEHLMRGYLEERQAWKTENAAAAETFVTSELAKTRRALDDVQGKLAAYRAENASLVLDSKPNGMAEQIGQYDQQRVSARLEVESLASLQDQLARPGAPLEAYMMGEAKDDAVLMALATALFQARQKLADTETRFNAPSSEVRQQRAQLDAQLESIRNYVHTRLSRARDNFRRLDGVVARSEAKLKAVPNAELGLAQLSRETDVYGAMYSLLLRRQQETALVKASTISKNRVLDPPDIPYREEMRQLGVGLASAPIGLVLGAVLVLVRSLLSGRLQHGADVRKHLGETPIFAAIPHVSYRSDQVSPQCLEAFRTLRANIYGACSRDRGKVVLFTSPCDGDGKTTCVHMLASILARGGQSVLLVDTNLLHGSDLTRRPKEYEDKGLSEILGGLEDWTAVAKNVPVSDECAFQVVPRGGEASNDLLSSPAMSAFIDEVRDAYDFVLLEAPSYPAVSDTMVLSALSDCVVAVIRMEHTRRALAVDSIRQLSRSPSPYGIVLNDIRA